jgi:hypothetical protein
MSITCKVCKCEFPDIDDEGNVYINYFGKRCLQCGNVIPPDKELPIIKNNIFKFEQLRAEALRSIKNRIDSYRRDKDDNI